jgi:hypothetical protein
MYDISTAPLLDMFGERDMPKMSSTALFAPGICQEVCNPGRQTLREDPNWTTVATTREVKGKYACSCFFSLSSWSHLLSPLSSVDISSRLFFSGYLFLGYTSSPVAKVFDLKHVIWSKLFDSAIGDSYTWIAYLLRQRDNENLPCVVLHDMVILATMHTAARASTFMDKSTYRQGHYISLALACLH